MACCALCPKFKLREALDATQRELDRWLCTSKSFPSPVWMYLQILLISISEIRAAESEADCECGETSTIRLGASWATDRSSDSGSESRVFDSDSSSESSDLCQAIEA